MTAAKILLYDIETSPCLGYYWSHPWETSIIQTTQEWHILCFAYKWLGETTKVIALPDFTDWYEADKDNDYHVVSKLHELFTEADIIIAHNGDKFDQKKVNARFLVHGFEPPEPYKQLDTLKLARKYFSFNSNKLDDLGETLGLGRKVKHPGFDMWKGCMEGNEESWKMMKTYNKGDVDLLEALYLKLRPWIDNHPGINAIEGRPDECPKCGGTHLQSRGLAITKTLKYRRFQCQDCGGWSRSRESEKFDPPLALVN